MARTGVIALIIFLVIRLHIEAQAPVTPVLIPDSRAVWTISILTSGGLDGRGQGGFNVTSAGEFTCNSTVPCTRQIQKPALQPLEGFIHSATLPQALQFSDIIPPFPIQTSPSVCFDCIVTTMSLRIRDSKGVEWNYAWSWDVTTQSSVPTEFMRIFRAATELAK
jgi:hypothetical protein